MSSIRDWDRGDGYEWKHRGGGWVDKDAVTGWWVAHSPNEKLGTEYYVGDARRLVETRYWEDLS